MFSSFTAFIKEILILFFLKAYLKEKNSDNLAIISSCQLNEIKM